MSKPKSDLKLRERAKEHLEQAKSLLASPTETNICYAALELRLCIECLAYRLLELYKPQSSFEAISKWQPDKMLKELVAVAGGVTSDLVIKIDFPGAETVEATEKRPDVKWVRSNWQALGSFLHTPTIHQMSKGRKKDSADAEARLQAIIEELDRIFSSEIFDIVLEFGTAWPCSCGFMINRSPHWLASNNRTSCSECGTEYEVYAADNEIRYRPIVIDWLCSECGTKNEIPIHKIKSNAECKCSFCGTNYKLKEQFRITKKT
ncbi:hypothetical protein [Methylobacterium sp. Leaf123]|uniref:hypothetical protein n=1 Tax=Methylobacterium sp. Leaf123 TaxID=1736264 RepID=UPI000B01FD2F|nr:hypothetical protein [Methylobacterium sp. Leaf123]